jgi:hypothetical protein
MKFCVCIKQVPDVTAPIQIRDGRLVFDTGRTVLNAYDASAVEAALVLVEQHGGEIDVVLIGPERATETVRKALAMGADRGSHLVLPDRAELDSAAVASLLAAELTARSADWLLVRDDFAPHIQAEVASVEHRVLTAVGIVVAFEQRPNVDSFRFHRTSSFLGGRRWSRHHRSNPRVERPCRRGSQGLRTPRRTLRRSIPAGAHGSGTAPSSYRGR